MEILAVIPARGGSKGIPYKNLEKINGISLVGIAVKNALDANCFSKVHVSTDSKLIKNEALKYNADCSYLRPIDMAKDGSKTNTALEFCLLKEREMGYSYDAICELQPTYVFRGKTIIKDSVAKFIELKDKFNSFLLLMQLNQQLTQIMHAKFEKIMRLFLAEKILIILIDKRFLIILVFMGWLIYQKIRKFFKEQITLQFTNLWFSNK